MCEYSTGHEFEHFWIENKGRVFAYALQTNKQHVLTVYCYHKKEFVKLVHSGKKVGDATRLERVPILSVGGQSEFFVFQNAELSPRNSKLVCTFYMLTPNF